MIFLTVLAMGALLSEPFFLRFLKDSLENAAPSSLIFLFIAYKITTSLLYVASDYISIVLGVRMYFMSILAVIKGVIKGKKEKNEKGIVKEGSNDNILWTILEDDCERIANLPYASINAFLKIFEIIVFCALIITRLPSHKFIVAFGYLFFIGITLFLAQCSFFVSRKMLKQK